MTHGNLFSKMKARPLNLICWNFAHWSNYFSKITVNGLTSINIAMKPPRLSSKRLPGNVWSKSANICVIYMKTNFIFSIRENPMFSKRTLLHIKHQYTLWMIFMKPSIMKTNHLTNPPYSFDSNPTPK